MPARSGDVLGPLTWHITTAVAAATETDLPKTTERAKPLIAHDCPFFTRPRGFSSLRDRYDRSFGKNQSKLIGENTIPDPFLVPPPLFCPGLTSLSGEVKHQGQECSISAIRPYVSMMMLATISHVIPISFRPFLASQGLSALHGLRATALDNTNAITLLLTYGQYPFYTLRESPELF